MKEEITKEELENKWWHRLVKVIIYLLSIWFFISETDNYYPKNYDATGWSILIFLILTVVVFLLCNVFYYKVILYIVYGKNQSIKMPFLSLNKLIVVIIGMLILAGVLASIRDREIEKEKARQQSPKDSGSIPGFETDVEFPSLDKLGIDEEFPGFTDEEFPSLDKLGID